MPAAKDVNHPPGEDGLSTPVGGPRDGGMLRPDAFEDAGAGFEVAGHGGGHSLAPDRLISAWSGGSLVSEALQHSLYPGDRHAQWWIRSDNRRRHHSRPTDSAVDHDVSRVLYLGRLAPAHLRLPRNDEVHITGA